MNNNQCDQGSSCSWAMLAGMITLMTGAQLLFKFAGLHAHAQQDWINGFMLNIPLWMGLAASGAGLICWLGALRNLPLATAYPWTALIYLLTPLASIVFFGEALGLKYVAGIILVAIGIFLSAGSVTKQ